jgi:hypothetical protein
MKMLIAVFTVYMTVISVIAITFIGISLIVSKRLSVENRDKHLINTWCRSKQLTLADYESCVKSWKPIWWPKEGE